MKVFGYSVQNGKPVEEWSENLSAEMVEKIDLAINTCIHDTFHNFEKVFNALNGDDEAQSTNAKTVQSQLIKRYGHIKIKRFEDLLGMYRWCGHQTYFDVVSELQLNGSFTIHSVFDVLLNFLAINQDLQHDDMIPLTKIEEIDALTFHIRRVTLQHHAGRVGFSSTQVRIPNQKTAVRQQKPFRLISIESKGTKSVFGGPRIPQRQKPVISGSAPNVTPLPRQNVTPAATSTPNNSLITALSNKDSVTPPKPPSIDDIPEVLFAKYTTWTVLSEIADGLKSLNPEFSKYEEDYFKKILRLPLVVELLLSAFTIGKIESILKQFDVFDLFIEYSEKALTCGIAFREMSDPELGQNDLVICAFLIFPADIIEPIIYRKPAFFLH